MSAVAARRIVDISGWGEQPPRWVRLLAAEVAASNMSRAGERIGVSRTAVSLSLANRYSSPSTAGIERRVLDALDRIECVVAAEPVSSVQCQTYRERPAPTHNPPAMRTWRQCLDCPNHPRNRGANA